MAGDEGLDEILSAIGMGLWQLPSLVLCILTHVVIPVHMMGSALLSAPVAFKCSNSSLVILSSSNINISSLSPPEGNLTTDRERHDDFIIPSSFDNKCLSPGNSPLRIEYPDGVGSLEVEGHPTGLPSCPWVSYDNTIFTSTVITEWDLICEKEMLRPLFQMAYSIGALFGSIIGGQVSDSYGRKRAIQFSSFINLSAVVILYVMPWYTGALIARVLLGGSCNFMVLPSYSLVLEISPPRHRTLVGMLMGTSFSVGIIILAGLGYFIRAWKHLMILDAVVPFVFLIPLAFHINESPRWLVQHGKPAEAARIVIHAVAVNKAALSQSLSDAIEELREKSTISTPTELHPNKTWKYAWSWCRSSCRGASKYLKSKALCIILIISPIIWILQGCLYLGIILNANNFTSNNPFVYITISGVMDLISILLATPLSLRMGRRVLITGAFFIGGVLLMADLFVPQEILWLKFILVMIALMLVAASFQVNFLYTPELYPTVIRARGFAFSSLAGNVGFLVAPLITDILSPLAWWSVSVTFGCGGIFASLLVPFLPETLHKPLPETVLDVEKRQQEGGSFLKTRRRRGRGDMRKMEETTELGGEECEALNHS